VEELAETVQSRIATRALMQGLAISRRFSPGYCDWHVNQQPMVFKSLGENNTGIKLNRSNLMTPQKSISGIIGLGPFGLADKYTPCRTCLKNRHCPWRRF
jgi:cobalamin-dependent methionine synthase I